jgi:hypothetical protein
MDGASRVPQISAVLTPCLTRARLRFSPGRPYLVYLLFLVFIAACGEDRLVLQDEDEDEDRAWQESTIYTGRFVNDDTGKLSPDWTIEDPMGLTHPMEFTIRDDRTIRHEDYLVYDNTQLGEGSARVLLKSPVFIQQLLPDVEDRNELVLAYRVREGNGWTILTISLSRNGSTWTDVSTTRFQGDVEDDGYIQVDVSGWQNNEVWVRIDIDHTHLKSFMVGDLLGLRWMKISRFYLD